MGGRNPPILLLTIYDKRQWRRNSNALDPGVTKNTYLSVDTKQSSTNTYYYYTKDTYYKGYTISSYTSKYDTRLTGYYSYESYTISWAVADSYTYIYHNSAKFYLAGPKTAYTTTAYYLQYNYLWHVDSYYYKSITRNNAWIFDSKYGYSTYTTVAYYRFYYSAYYGQRVTGPFVNDGTSQFERGPFYILWGSSGQYLAVYSYNVAYHPTFSTAGFLEYAASYKYYQYYYANYKKYYSYYYYCEGPFSDTSYSYSRSYIKS